MCFMFNSFDVDLISKVTTRISSKQIVISLF